MNVQDDKKKESTIKLIAEIIAIITWIITVIIAAAISYEKLMLEKKVAEREQKYREREQNIEDWEESPNIEVEERRKIPLEGVEFKGYTVYDSSGNIDGAFLEDAMGVIVIKSGGTIIKVLLIKDAVRTEELSLEEKQGLLSFFVREPEEIELKIENIRKAIKEYLQSDGAENCEYSVQFAVLTTIKYTNKSNVGYEGRYMIFTDENVRCEVVKDEYEKCDRYYCEYGITEQGNEFEEMIRETSERIRKQIT